MLPGISNYGIVDVLVYTTGKTGGSTLTASFSKLGVGIVHTHFCDPTTGNEIVNCPRPKKLLVISCYRDVVSQCVSDYFENITQATELPLEQILEKDDEWIKNSIVEYVGKVYSFYNNYQPFLPANNQVYDNLNIYDWPFNKQDGYVIVESPLVRVIVLRFDKIKNWTQIIRAVTEYKNFVMVPFNITQTKPVGKLYSKIRDSIVIPKHILDTIYEAEAKNMEYFYTQDEIASIKKRWYDRLPKD